MSKRTLIRCKKCDRPLGDTREDKIRVMQFLQKMKKGIMDIEKALKQAEQKTKTAKARYLAKITDRSRQASAAPAQAAAPPEAHSPSCCSVVLIPVGSEPSLSTIYSCMAVEIELTSTHLVVSLAC